MGAQTSSYTHSDLNCELEVHPGSLTPVVPSELESRTFALATANGSEFFLLQLSPEMYPQGAC